MRSNGIHTDTFNGAIGQQFVLEQFINVIFSGVLIVSVMMSLLAVIVGFAANQILMKTCSLFFLVANFNPQSSCAARKMHAFCKTKQRQ